MFPSASGIVIHGGTFNSQTNRTSRGMDLLMEWVATGAFHNSDELCDAPKCHPGTRVAVLEDIMEWVGESESVRENFMLWLFGSAGAGKTAIAKGIANKVAEEGMLIATFFFSRTSATRSTKDRLISTLAYQLALAIPSTRIHIEEAIERDPAIFKKNIQTQIDTLLIKPFQSVPTQINPIPKLIIIDGLDECYDSQTQVSILDAISCSFHKRNLPIRFLVVSRPELDITTSFNSSEPLKSIHRRLALDDTYLPYDDIRLFFSDKFELIRRIHPLRSTIPNSWPTQETIRTLIRKSSGQFIYAATVVRFVESKQHRPTSRLDMILGISPPGKMNPFAELDALYYHILSSVDDIQLTLRVLSLYVVAPNFALVSLHPSSMSPEAFLSLEEGDIYLVLINLSSIVSYDESSGYVKVLHASLVDFLSDERRSTVFYTDITSTCTDFAHHVFEYIKAPDGIQSGDVSLLWGVLWLHHQIPKGQLRSEILHFDFDAFMKAASRRHLKHITSPKLSAFDIWIDIIQWGLDDEDINEAVLRCKDSFKSQIQRYQSDWRLQLLLTLTVTPLAYTFYEYPVMEMVNSVPECRIVDILLEMVNDHDLHLLDQDTLDLRHGYWMGYAQPFKMMSLYVDGDRYASAALHCMRFLSNPPTYSDSTDSPEMGLIYIEWKATCAMAIIMLSRSLPEANTSPEVVQFISNNDIDAGVQNILSVDEVQLIDAYILAFLSRANVCINWRIISAIQRGLLTTDESMNMFGEDDPDEESDNSDEESDNSDEESDNSDEESDNSDEESDEGWVSRVDKCCLERH